jgi:hypothetical protein
MKYIRTRCNCKIGRLNIRTTMGTQGRQNDKINIRDIWPFRMKLKRTRLGSS